MAPNNPPRFLIIDDDDDFLQSTLAFHEQTELSQHAVIDIWTFSRVGEAALLQKIREQMALPDGYAAIVVDLNLKESGTSKGGLDLIDRLREGCAPLEYVPAIIMTASVDPELQREAFDRRIESFIIKLDGAQRSPEHVLTGLLSHRLITDLPQWQAQAEERFWLDLNEFVGSEIARRSSIPSICQAAGNKLLSHFQASAIYVRERTSSGLLLLGGEDGFDVGEGTLAEHDLPFVRDALEAPEGKTVFRYDSLDCGNSGHLYRARIMGSRVMVALMTFDGTRLGYIAIYRPATVRAFRRLDEGLVGLLAQQLAAAVYRSRQLVSLESRQQRLAAMLQDFTHVKSEEDIFQRLAADMHELVAEPPSPGRSKTTTRRLKPGTDEIPRLGKPLGRLDGLKDPVDVTLRRADEYRVAKAMITGRPMLDNAVTDKSPGFAMTAVGMRSHLAVPILSQGVGVGALNIESMEPGVFRDTDQEFVVSACASAADAVIRLRSQRFALGIAGLLDAIVTGHGQEKGGLLDRAVQLLFDYTGFAELLYLTPSEPRQPWTVRNVFNNNGQTDSPERLQRWRNHTSAHWDATFIKRVVSDDHLSVEYTEAGDHISGDADARNGNATTRAEAVVLLRDIEKRPQGALALLFVHPLALSPSQLDVLGQFGRTLTLLLQHQGEVGMLHERLAVEAMNARIGEAFGFIRHSLRNKLGDIRQSALDLDKTAPDIAAIGRHIRTRLTDAERDIARGRNLVKPAISAPVLLAEVWEKVRAELGGLATRQGCTIAQATFTVATVLADAEILEAILALLVENALLHGGGGITVRAESSLVGDKVAIDIADDGLGLPQSVKRRLFEVGISTIANSTGAGLFLSRARARSLGGDLDYVERLRGAVFRLTMPIDGKGATS
jgi:signal transduction histidine kinase/GAF domain-containing protein